MQVAEIFNTMSYGPAPESAKKVDTWLESHRDGFGLFINGEWVNTAENFDSVSPANGRCLAGIAAANSDDVDAAVQAARAAQPAWEALGGRGRARYLYRLAQLLQKRAREFAVLESLDSGKSIREAGGVDIPLAIRQLHHHAGWAQLMETEFPGQYALGVAGQIVPDSSPLLAAMQKIAPALAAGNGVVLKPAERTSLTALMFAELCEDADLPPGVVNIVTGDDKAGGYVVDHPGIDAIAFAGSAEQGRDIRNRAAGGGKKLNLEAVLKLPFIVFEDADLDAAVEGLMEAVCGNPGLAGIQLLVQEGIEQRAIDRVRARMEKLHVGDPLDNNTDLGAFDPACREHIARLVEQGVGDGADLWQAGSDDRQESGCYPPTLLGGVEPTNIVAREPIPGPVVTVTSFRLPSEAVELAGGGPAASLWSENINRALDVGPQLKVAEVWINSGNPCDTAADAGRDGIEEYLRPPFELTDTESAPAAAGMATVADAAAVAVPPPEARHYIDGGQVSPENGEFMAVTDAAGRTCGHVAEGNRKDIDRAVRAASRAEGWSRSSGFDRGQRLRQLADSLYDRQAALIARLERTTGVSGEAAVREFETGLSRLYTYAAWADKFGGAVQLPSRAGLVLTVNQALGVVGIGCPDRLPLLSLVSLLAPALAAGNRVVLVPSEKCPLVATDFFRVLETAEIPAGAVNIVTGARDALTQALAEHEWVDGLWCFGHAAGCRSAQQTAARTGKRVLAGNGSVPDWLSREAGEGRYFLRAACRVKRLWIPCGD